MKKLIWLTSAVFFLSTPIYAQDFSVTNQEQTTITEQQAIEAAKTYAINQMGVSADWFGGRVFTSSDGNGWKIFFGGKPVYENGPYLTGDHFLAFVTPGGLVTKFSR
jgi:hypothetical protein